MYAVAALFLNSVVVPLAAQQSSTKHYHYQLIDMGTLGGPSSYFNSLFLTDVFGFPSMAYGISKVRNPRGTFVGFADTPVPDPFPSFCYVPDCFVTHAFQWNDGAVSDLGALPGGGSSAAFWINASGDIVGGSENGETDPVLPGLPELRAVVWSNSNITDLGTLGGSHSFAQSINDHGQITGIALNNVTDSFSFFYQFFYCLPFGLCPSNATETRGFVWDEKDGMVDIGTLGGPDNFPAVINNRGQVAGFAYTNSSPNPYPPFLPTYHPYLWDKRHGMKDLGSFGGDAASVNGLNERGEVVGGDYFAGDTQLHPFLWNGKKFLDLTAPPFAWDGNGEANWINEAGEVVGNAGLDLSCDGVNTDFHAFLWTKGVMSDLGHVAGEADSRADFINSLTQVVGVSFPCDFSFSTAFLWENGSIVDLNTLVPPNSPLSLFWAPFIDDEGVIGAFGSLANGDMHVALLIPCDENHPGIEGCDYSLVDASTAVAAHFVPPPASPINNRSPFGLQSRLPGLLMRNRLTRLQLQK
jgi:probable HAF family extracellular repeat protein